jgi:probable HAF family extracellular repeat protein
VNRVIFSLLGRTARISGLAALLSAPALFGQMIYNLGTLGGSFSGVTGLNITGQVIGESNTASDAALLAYRFSGGTMTGLALPGYPDSKSVAINSGGQVAGDLKSVAGLPRAFLFSGGIVTDLGTLGGTESSTAGINSGGDVVGSSYTTDDDATHAFVYSLGTMHDLGAPVGKSTYGMGINDVGQVTGNIVAYTTSGAISEAFRYSGSLLSGLGTLGGTNSWGIAINNSGWVAGHSETSTPGQTRAFLFDGASLQDLGALGGAGSSSESIGLNDAGQVIGVSVAAPGGNDRAFLYSGGTMHDLGQAGDTFSEPTSINSVGEVTGLFQLPTEALSRAFLYTGGTRHDLNVLYAGLLSTGSTPGFRWLYTASAVNDLGLIAGEGKYFDGVEESRRAFLIDPTATPPPPPVPEATMTLGLLILALAIVVVCRARISPYIVTLESAADCPDPARSRATPPARPRRRGQISRAAGRGSFPQRCPGRSDDRPSLEEPDQSDACDRWPVLRRLDSTTGHKGSRNWRR